VLFIGHSREIGQQRRLLADILIDAHDDDQDRQRQEAEHQQTRRRPDAGSP
jgi:hypothetical protein